MCGIVAVTGYKKALPLLINGLEKLEYRGYDSAGIAIINSETNNIVCNKAEGKLNNLKVNLKEKNIPFLRRKLGVVFQDFKLLNDRTVIDNLKFVQSYL